MTDMVGMSTPDIGGPADDRGTPESDALFDAKELRDTGTPETNLARAERMMREMTATNYRDALGGGANREAIAREIANLVLARISIPGDVALHERIFEMAGEIVAEA